MQNICIRLFASFPVLPLSIVLKLLFVNLELHFISVLNDLACFFFFAFDRLLIDRLIDYATRDRYDHTIIAYFTMGAYTIVAIFITI